MRERERERERGRENERAPRFAPSSSGRVPPSTETGVHRGRLAFSPPTLWGVPPPPETGVHRGRLAFSPPTLWGVPPPPETGVHRGRLASTPPSPPKQVSTVDTSFAQPTQGGVAAVTPSSFGGSVPGDPPKAGAHREHLLSGSSQRRTVQNNSSRSSMSSLSERWESFWKVRRWGPPESRCSR